MAVEITPDQEIWVITPEGAELTGYSREYLERLANKNFRLSDDERLIKIRKRAGRYELWLPDLLHTSMKSVTARTRIKNKRPLVFTSLP